MRCLMRMVLAVGVALMALPVGRLSSAELDWVRSHEQMSALSQLGAAYSLALICERPVDRAGAARALARILGSDGGYSAVQLADVLSLVTGTHAMHRAAPGLVDSAAARAKACTDAQLNYGPTGWVFPGFFK